MYVDLPALFSRSNPPKQLHIYDIKQSGEKKKKKLRAQQQTN